MNNPINKIRIGTLIGGHAKLGDYIRQIADYGFESFQINFWGSIPEDVDLPKLADDVFDAIGDRDIVIGALGLVKIRELLFLLITNAKLLAAEWLHF